MAKKYLIFCLLVCLLLGSCEFVTQEQSDSAGAVHALLVGLSYDGTDYNTLSGTIPDVVSMDKTLFRLCSDTQREYLPVLMEQDSSYNNPSVETFPTKAHVLEQVDYLKSNAADNDLTIFFYSGHGLPSTDTEKNGALCLINSKNKLECLYLPDLLDKINAIPGKKLIILDSCYSGNLVDLYGVTACTDISTSDIFASYFSDASYGLTDLFLMTASTSETISYDNDHGHGSFSLALLQALGWESDDTIKTAVALLDDKITIDSLYAYVLENCNYRLFQHVTVNGTADDLVLFSYDDQDV